MQLQSNWDYELSRNKNTQVFFLSFFLLKCPYLDVFWRSAPFLFHINCGVREANKKEGGGGSVLLEDYDGTYIRMDVKDR